MSTASTTAANVSPSSPEPWHWDDPTSYQWALWVPRPDIAGLLVKMLSLGLVGPLILFGYFWVISFFSTTLAYWMCVVVIALFVVTTVLALSILLWSKRPSQRKLVRAGIYLTNTLLMGCLLYELSSPLSHLAHGFHNGPGAGFWQWLLFFADNTFSVVLLDIPEVFELQLSRIQYESWAARAVTVLIRLLITAGLVEVGAQIIRSHYSRDQFHGTVQDCYWHIAALPDRSQLHLRCDCRLAPLTTPSEQSVATFLDRYKAFVEKQTT